MDPKDRRVKTHQEEMKSPLNLKSRLDHEEAVSSYAGKYQKLGWVLQAVNPQDGTDLGVDFGEGQVAPAPPSCDPEMQETWWWLCPPRGISPEKCLGIMPFLWQEKLRPTVRVKRRINRGRRVSSRDV
jgi:hypothetical protein